MIVYTGMMQWQSSLDQPPANCPGQRWSWLISADSLTSRLRKISGAMMNIELLRAEWSALIPEESAWLTSAGTSAASRIWVREIVHLHYQQVWIWAKTLIPETTLQKTGLDAENGQPIGDILFKDPHLTRTHLAVAQLTHEHAYYGCANAQLQKPTAPLWARRSVLWFKRYPLFIVEVFLPDFWSFA